MTLYFSLGTSDSSLHSPCVCCAELDIRLDVLSSFVANGKVLFLTKEYQQLLVLP